MCEVSSQELSDALVESFQDQLKPDKERRQKAFDLELLLKAKGFFNMDCYIRKPFSFILSPTNQWLRIMVLI